MLEWIASPEAWVAFGTLVALEIVLGIDNIIFISILAGKLPPLEGGMRLHAGSLKQSEEHAHWTRSQVCVRQKGPKAPRTSSLLPASAGVRRSL